MTTQTTQQIVHKGATSTPAARTATTAPLTIAQRLQANQQLVATLAPEIQTYHLEIIQGKPYMKVAGGIAIAQALGFAISVGPVEMGKDADGEWYAAVATLTDIVSGMKVAEATGYLGKGEGDWSSKPIAAQRSMCQTRAEAKLCRANFGSIYTLLGADSDTPAEEMQTVAQPAKQVTNTAAPTSTTGSSNGALGQGTYTGTIEEVRTLKEGESAKGTPWSLFKVMLAGLGGAVTFDREIAALASSAQRDGSTVTITVTEDSVGPKVTELTIERGEGVTVEVPDEVPF